MGFATAVNCCCPADCPPGTTKEDFGLPDALSIEVSDVAGSSTGMPSDTIVGYCDATPIYAHWTHSDALITLLTSFIYDYVEQVGGSGCCWRYQSRGTVEPCGGAGDYVNIGDSPFAASVVDAATSAYVTWRDNLAVPPEGDPPPTEECCPGAESLECLPVCGPSFVWTSGTARTPGDVFAKASARICINGDIVTVTITVDLVITYNQVVGDDCEYQGASLEGVYPSCSGDPGYTTCGSGVTTCEELAGGISITATADLTGIEGDTVWDRLKASECTGTFGYGICGPGGGCIGVQTEVIKDCDVNNSTCHCDSFTVAENATTDVAIDQECIYSYGTLKLIFTDAV